MTDLQRDDWRNKIDLEFRSIAKAFKIGYKPVFLYSQKVISVENISFPCPEKVSKGIAVRIASMAILTWIDRTFGPSRRQINWLVLVDGTGAYVDQVRHIISALDSGSIAVIGERVGHDWGISPERKLIEFFEMHLLNQTFGCQLRDCQAGIWGLRLDLFQRVSLTVSGYGLEFDLMAGLLGSLTDFDYADVTVNPDRSPSTYSVDQACIKLRFIVQRLHLGKRDFLRLWRSYRGDLPRDYRESVEQLLANDPDSFVQPLFPDE